MDRSSLTYHFANTINVNLHPGRNHKISHFSISTVPAGFAYTLMERMQFSIINMQKHALELSINLSNIECILDLLVIIALCTVNDTCVE